VGECQQVVHNEMRSDIGCARHEMLVGRVQMPDVSALQDQEDDPVDASHDEILREWSSHPSVLSPYCMAVMVVVAVCRSIERVVESCDDHKQPGDNGQDLIGDQGTFVELGAFRKWIVSECHL